MSQWDLELLEMKVRDLRTKKWNDLSLGICHCGLIFCFWICQAFWKAKEL